MASLEDKLQDIPHLIREMDECTSARDVGSAERLPQSANHALKFLHETIIIIRGQLSRISDGETVRHGLQHRSVEQDLLKQEMANKQLHALVEDKLCDLNDLLDGKSTGPKQVYKCRLEPSPRGGRSGRRRCDVSESQVLQQRNIHQTWTETARLAGVSRTTLHRRRRQWGMDTTLAGSYSNITDDQLDEVLKEILSVSPRSGERILIGALRGRDLRVQRWRIREAIKRVDPFGIALRRPGGAAAGRTYDVEWPNDIWHLDDNHKLIRWGFSIHVGIDGNSRLITYLHCSTDNCAATVLCVFQDAVREHGLPSRVRTDSSVANKGVAQFMVSARGRSNHDGVITERTVCNQRIGRLWGEVNRGVVTVFQDKFNALEAEHLLDPTDKFDLYCLHSVYQSAINEALKQFVTQYNHHPITTEHCKSPLQLWHSGMLQKHGRDYVNLLKVEGLGGAVTIGDGDPVMEEELRDDFAQVPEMNSVIKVEGLDGTASASGDDPIQKAEPAVYSVRVPGINSLEVEGSGGVVPLSDDDSVIKEELPDDDFVRVPETNLVLAADQINQLHQAADQYDVDAHKERYLAVRRILHDIVKH